MFQFEWPELNENSEHHDVKMIYHFEYLPAGLFNRAQVSVDYMSLFYLLDSVLFDIIVIL